MLTTRTKIFGGLALSALAMAIAAAAGIIYMIAATETALAEQTHRLAKQHAVERELSALTALIEETREERALIASYVLTEDSVVSFLSDIEAAAAEQGVTIGTRSLAVTPIAGNATFEELTLEVAVLGPYEAVRAMLAIYETLPYQVSIRSVVIERISNTEGASAWRGTYQIAVTKFKTI